MMKFIVLAVVFAASYKVEYGAEILSTIMLLLSAIYYSLVYRVMTGLNTAKLGSTDLHPLQRVTLNTLTNAIAIVTLILNTDYTYVGWIATPWIIVTSLMTITGWAVYFNVITISNKNEDG